MGETGVHEIGAAAPRALEPSVSAGRPPTPFPRPRTYLPKVPSPNVRPSSYFPTFLPILDGLVRPALRLAGAGFDGPVDGLTGTRRRRPVHPPARGGGATGGGEVGSGDGRVSRKTGKIRRVAPCSRWLDRNDFAAFFQPPRPRALGVVGRDRDDARARRVWWRRIVPDGAQIGQLPMDPGHPKWTRTYPPRCDSTPSLRAGPWRDTPPTQPRPSQIFPILNGRSAHLEVSSRKRGGPSLPPQQTVAIARPHHAARTNYLLGPGCVDAV